MIPLANDSHLVTGHNPTYGQNVLIYSYCTKVHTPLTVTFVIHMSKKYYMIDTKNTINVICDNEACINELSFLLDDNCRRYILNKLHNKKFSI